MPRRLESGVGGTNSGALLVSRSLGFLRLRGLSCSFHFISALLVTPQKRPFKWLPVTRDGLMPEFRVCEGAGSTFTSEPWTQILSGAGAVLSEPPSDAGQQWRVPLPVSLSGRGRPTPRSAPLPRGFFGAVSGGCASKHQHKAPTCAHPCDSQCFVTGQALCGVTLPHCRPASAFAARSGQLHAALMFGRLRMLGGPLPCMF